MVYLLKPILILKMPFPMAQICCTWTDGRLCYKTCAFLKRQLLKLTKHRERLKFLIIFEFIPPLFFTNMKIKSFLAKPYAGVVANRLKKSMHTALADQQSILQQLLKQGNKTKFGK